jgi:UPF0716 family protein affecting phage T7 exclusion
LLFLSQIAFSPLVQVLVYKHVAETQQWILPDIGFFRTLLLIYFVPFIAGVFIVGHTVTKHYRDISAKGPYFM